MEDKYYVIATDKFLSGWGHAERGKSVIVVKCQDQAQQTACERAMSYDKELKNIRTHYGKKPVIRNAGHVQYMDFLKCPRWNRDYMFQHQSKNENNNVKRINESQLRAIVAESVKKVLNEFGETPQGLGAVAQNIDRRTSQMNNTYRNPMSSVPQRIKAMGNTFDAQKYLGQAIQNALANGMSEQEIEQVLQQNMSQNFNPTYNNGTLNLNRR